MKTANEIIAPFLAAIGYTGKATGNASVYPEDVDTLRVLIEEEFTAIKQKADRHLLDQAVQYENQISRWQSNYYELQRETERLTRQNNELMYGKESRPGAIQPMSPHLSEFQREYMKQAEMLKQFQVDPYFLNKGTP